MKFLIEEEKRLCSQLQAAQDEEVEIQRERNYSEQWTGLNPYLRMYHVLMEDTVRHAFMSRNDVLLDRQALDACNSSSRLPTFYKIVVKTFNDSTFNPTTEALPNLDEYFVNPIELKFEDAPTPTSPDKVKDKLADVRAKLVILISDWEKSGNGGGNRAETDTHLSIVVYIFMTAIL
jgi:hypothetical protein